MLCALALPLCACSTEEIETAAGVASMLLDEGTTSALEDGADGPTVVFKSGKLGGTDKGGKTGGTDEYGVQAVKVGKSSKNSKASSEKAEEEKGVDLDSIPKWKGMPYTALYKNKAKFSKSQKSKKESFVKYSRLDKLGRARVALGCLSKDTINYGKRVDIGHIRPSGWQTVKFSDIVDGNYVYNRSHLLMQKAAAGADMETCNSEQNLVTGTRYMNVDGMLPFENQVLDYIFDTGNHVLYRVAPVYRGDNLVPSGVHMEAYSVEDKGKGLNFNVYCYNMQPGLSIDYKTGSVQKKSDPAKDIVLALKHGATTVSESFGD